MKAFIKDLIPLTLKVKIRRALNNTKIKIHNFPENLAPLKCIIKYNKYGGYCIPIKAIHRPAAHMILSNRVYESQTIEFIRNNAKGGDIIHAGTFFGDFLPALATAIQGHAKIWAFEPNPESYRCAQITILINNIKNTHLTNAGLGARNDISFIETVDDHGNELGGASRITSSTNGKKKAAKRSHKCDRRYHSPRKTHFHNTAGCRRL